MKNDPILRLAGILLIISILLAGTIFAESILNPFATSIFFAYLFYPLTRKIEKHKIHFLKLWKSK